MIIYIYMITYIYICDYMYICKRPLNPLNPQAHLKSDIRPERKGGEEGSAGTDGLVRKSQAPLPLGSSWY